MTELRPWVWCLPFFGTRCMCISLCTTVIRNTA